MIVPAAATEVRLEWWPQPRQLAFLRAMGIAHPFDAGEPTPPVAGVIGYGGAAGGGKTDAFVMAAAIVALTWPGAQVAYFRREYPDLEGPGGAIPRSLALLGPLRTAGVVKWNDGKHKWVFGNGSVIQFLHCKSPKDVYGYQSQQFDLLLIDEATHFEESMVAYLTSRNRLTVNMPAPLCGMASNPGNIGHAWFNRIFDPEGEVETVRDGQWEGSDEPFTAYFLPAKLQDNQALERRDPGYRRKLEAMPRHLRDQLLHGKWDSFEGQAFPQFTPAPGGPHVCRPFPIPKWWRRWRANDPGYTDPGPWYWLAADQEGAVYIYREYTRQTAQDERVTYSDQAKTVADLSVMGGEVGAPEVELDPETGESKPVKERVDYTVTGMDAFNRHPETGKAITDYYRDGGVGDCIKPVHGPGARAAMYATWTEYLKVFDGPDGRPAARVRIFSTCRRLIETLPLLITDEKHPDQVAETEIDHWYQAAGYGLQAWHAERSRGPTPSDPPVLAAKKRVLQAVKRRARRPVM